MAATSIEWCDHSVNPIRARDKRTGAVGHYCEKIASGCAQCYASRLQTRFNMPAFGGRKESLPENIEVFLDDSKLDEVRRRKKPTRYFWEDMSDLFGWWVKPEWIAKCFQAMDDTPQHTHILLTKRPENVRRMWASCPCEGDYCTNPSCDWPDNRFNVWLLTSIANQSDADRNLPLLLKCRDLVPVLGVSAEPLLESVVLNLIPDECKVCGNRSVDGFLEHSKGCYMVDEDGGGVSLADEYWPIDWVICGCESGPTRREMPTQAAESLAKQCREAGVAFFMKQMQIDGKVCGDIERFPEALRVRQFPHSELTTNDTKGTR